MGGKALPFLADDVTYTSMWLAAWMSGASCLPLCNTHPAEELRFAIATSDADTVLATPRYEASIREACNLAGLPTSAVRVVEPMSPGGPASGQVEAGCALLRQLCNQDPALMLYTSGTTSNPKGVIHTHGSLSAQTEALAQAWGWSSDDRCLNVLPMHHLHGVVVLMLTAMRAGATVDWANQGRFSPVDTWRRLLSLPDSAAQPTVFMAVPTIYGRLLDAVAMVRSESSTDPFASDWNPLPGSEEAEEKAELLALLRDEDGLRRRLERLRLMTSGSAPLAESMGRAWENVSGHRLLERLGMTETGMIASNPLHPASSRRLGTVGTALPGVEVCLGPDISDPDQATPALDTDAPVGELWVRGRALFREYYKRPEAMEESFTEDGWFKTGDIASIDQHTGTVRVLGRASADIIKSRGYKLSALDIETAMLDHDGVSEVTVFGVDDDDIGERVVALVVGANIDPNEMREWLKGRLAAYKLPSDVVPVGSIPRNAMGKVNKKQLRRLWQEDGWRGGPLERGEND